MVIANTQYLEFLPCCNQSALEIRHMLGLTIKGVSFSDKKDCIGKVVGETFLRQLPRQFSGGNYKGLYEGLQIPMPEGPGS
jgi:hypothetical protein